MYILHSHIIAHVSTSAEKDILTQPDPQGQRGKWIAVMLEYDLEIKPIKLIKGQVLAKLMDRSNYDALSLHMIFELSIEEKNPQEQPDPPVDEHFLSSSRYTDIIFVLQHLQDPQGMDPTRGIFLKYKASRFCIIDGNCIGRIQEGCY